MICGKLGLKVEKMEDFCEMMGAEMGSRDAGAVVTAAAVVGGGIDNVPVEAKGAGVGEPPEHREAICVVEEERGGVDLDEGEGGGEGQGEGEGDREAGEEEVEESGWYSRKVWPPRAEGPVEPRRGTVFHSLRVRSKMWRSAELLEDRPLPPKP